jgi:hypothetical protein
VPLTHANFLRSDKIYERVGLTLVQIGLTVFIYWDVTDKFPDAQATKRIDHKDPRLMFCSYLFSPIEWFQTYHEKHYDPSIVDEYNKLYAQYQLTHKLSIQ